jgi:hypothetical protein
MLSRVVLIGAFFIGSAALSHANPLDSPDIVYIDGTPCNSACQSYMAWSRKVLSERSAPAQSNVASPRAAATVPAKPKAITQDRAATTRAAKSEKIARTRQPKGSATPVPVRKPVDIASRDVPNPAAPNPTPSNPANPAVTNSVSPSAADPIAANPSPSDQVGANPGPSNSSPSNSSPSNSSADKPADTTATIQPTESTPAPGPVEKPAEKTAGLQQPDVGTPSNSVGKDATPAEPSINAGSKASSKPGASTKRLQDQVTAAAALAEQLTSTAAARPELRAMNGSSQGDKATISTGNSAVPSPDVSEAWVALVISRPDIKAVADLAGKNVAIDGKRSGSANDVRVALVAAGATEVHVSSADTKAIERLMNDEVPAAVLTLVSPDAAETFPEIGGYKVFRVPLSPSPLKAPQDKP